MTPKEKRNKIMKVNKTNLVVWLTVAIIMIIGTYIYIQAFIGLANEIEKKEADGRKAQLEAQKLTDYLVKLRNSGVDYFDEREYLKHKQ